MRWPWRRDEPAGVRAAGFDAVVDVCAALDAETADAAIRAVEAAVRSVPGARSVRVRPGEGPDRMAVRLFSPGRAEPREGEAWSALREQVAGAAMGALESLHAGPRRRGREAFALPAPVTTGFAEAPMPLDALAELAALARSVRPAPPRRAAADEAEVAMMGRLLGLVLPEVGATAAAAVRRFGSFAAVLAAPERELRMVPGLGPHCVAAIKLVHEAAVRLARARVTGQPVLSDPARLTAYLLAAVGRARVEQFRILFLDGAGLLLGDEVQATGTVNHTPVYPREVVRRALELRAAAVVLVHNHPSGDPTPSADDLAMTADIRRAAEALGIGVRDHVIVGNGRTLSFREAGLLR